MAFPVLEVEDLKRPADAAGCAGSAGSPGGVAEPPSMASAVTRHAQNPLEQFKFLLCGVDSLDLGLFVTWSARWPIISSNFQNKKDVAFGTKGILDQTDQGRSYLHHSSGKPPSYRYHLQFSEYHLYIGITESPHKTSPNLYASINSEALWLKGMRTVINQMYADIAALGGKLTDVTPSRVDLAADFLIPGGLTHDFLMDHRVTRSRANNTHFTDRNLETAYFGDSGSPIRLRIYNKSLEVENGGIKRWFLSLWGIEENKDVWRIEFQLRRPALKQYGINNLKDFVERIAGVWENLTTEWFSLRLPDNDKTERRTTHPLWFEIQACSKQLGAACFVEREYLCNTPAAFDWYIAQISGFIISIAARLGNPNRDDVFTLIQQKVNGHCHDDRFKEEYAKKRICLGKSVKQGGKDEEYPF